MLWLAPAILSVIFIILFVIILAEIEEDSPAQIAGAFILLLAVASIFIYNMVICPEFYKDGQIDALNGKVKYKISVIDSTNTNDWDEINE